MKTYFDITGDAGSQVLNQVQGQMERLHRRLSTVRTIYAVGSGKGGVGKSSLSVQIACDLAQRGKRVGILDADLNGPCIPRMLGVHGTSPHMEIEGCMPVAGPNGVRVMSTDFFLTDASQPVNWKSSVQSGDHIFRGIVEATVLREMLSDTAWGSLDYLIIDMAPGTGWISALADVLPFLSGFVLVTIPSEISQQVVLKSVTQALRFRSMPVAGLIENMKGYVCSHCQKVEDLFPGDSRAMAQAAGVPYLGCVPFDPVVSVSCDLGKPLVSFAPGTPSVRAIAKIVDRLEIK